MTPREVVRFVREHVTYKPGYSLQAHVADGGVELDITVPTGTDASGKCEGRYDVCYSEFFSTGFLERHSPIWTVRQFLFRWEQHECEEWLRVDGILARDPHSSSVNFVDGEGV